MAHVELSLTEAFDLPEATLDLDSRTTDDSFGRWAATVAAADEPCLVIDSAHTIVSASVSCCTLLGLGEPAQAAGLPLLDAGLRLVDFTAARGELTETEIERIPPLLAVTSGRLARGLLRMRGGGDGGGATVDALATPLFVGGAVAGSLTFFSPV